MKKEKITLIGDAFRSEEERVFYSGQGFPFWGWASGSVSVMPNDPVDNSSVDKLKVKKLKLKRSTGGSSYKIIGNLYYPL